VTAAVTKTNALATLRMSWGKKILITSDVCFSNQNQTRMPTVLLEAIFYSITQILDPTKCWNNKDEKRLKRSQFKRVSW